MLTDAKYNRKDVKWAKEQEFLHLKLGETISVMEYVIKFNEHSRFAKNHMATEEDQMD